MRGRPFLKGNIPWNSGKNYSGMSGKNVSSETRDKISDKKTGIKREKFNEEWLSNMSKAQKGISKSLEHRNKISIALKGRKLSNIHIEKLKSIKGELASGYKDGRTKGKEYNCTNCGRIIIKYRSANNTNKTFCNHKCFKEYTKGDKCSSWRGGITPLYKARLNFPEYKEKLKQVYKRDDYKCQSCGDSKNKLEAHHIVPWRISHNDEMDNLITVCRTCHRKIEMEWRKANE